ncbi:MAG: hypothetical protein Q8P37_01665 [Candidatus Spechtbacteria bacterium]|nr:hypothetical protein [Candidatus Spechtbacteria bacterium]
MREKLTYKFGGSCLSNDADYEDAARFLLEDSKDAVKPVFVVVSAQKGETDRLLKEADNLFIDPWERVDHVARNGEFVSAEKMAGALNWAGGLLPGAEVLYTQELGIMAEGEDPFNGNLVGIKDDLSERIYSARFIIVPGYVGVHKTKGWNGTNALIALGRGASDLIAVEVARATRSKLKLVKSAQSIYSVSPDFVDNPKPITHMTPDQALRVLEYIRSDEQFIMANAVKHAQRKNVALEFCSMSNPEEFSRIDSIFRPEEPELFRALPVKENVALIRMELDTKYVSWLYESLHEHKIPFNDGGSEESNGKSRIYIFAEAESAKPIIQKAGYLSRNVEFKTGSLITLIDTSLDPEGNHFMRVYNALNGISVLHSLSSGVIMHIFVSLEDTKKTVKALAKEFELIAP